MFKKPILLLALLLVLWPTVVSSQYQGAPVSEVFSSYRVWGFDGATQTWKLYDPSVPSISDLRYLERGLGYWVKSTQESLVFYQENQYPLYKGWNLIGWIGTTAFTPRNPSYAELIAFLKVDDTNEMIYKDPEFVCWDFQATLRGRARDSGFKSGWVRIAFTIADNHSINVFQTPDRGVTYIDVTGDERGTGWDKIAILEVGKTISWATLDSSASVSAPDWGTITNIWVNWN